LGQCERSPDKTIQFGSDRGFVIVHLLNPAFNEPDPKVGYEPFDRQHFQVRQDTVLKMRSGVFCIELHLPDPSQFNVVLGE
jgi:hypothetical protein